ncbi:serine/threonine-protein kinase [Campylobacterota bacterium DY0563]
MNIIKQITKKSSKNKKNEKLELLNKRYYCLEEVGRGGLSIVYKAIDIYSDYFGKNSNIVIKIPTKELLEKDDIAAFVYSEYRFLRRLSLDSIVKVLDFGIDKKTNLPFLVLEYIEGELLSESNLIDISKDKKDLIFKSLCESLKYIHDKGIVHSDISPTNIIINNDLRPIIFDFGISQDITKENSLSLEYKKIKAINPKYCAPELFEENSKPTKSSDIFSLAVLLYEIYSEKPLFEESSKELYSLPIDKRDLSKIPFFLRKWFKRNLSLDEKRRILEKKYLFYL